MPSRRRLLLWSNSTLPNQDYLEHTLGPIADFLGDNVREVVFVPYAGVVVSWDEYAALVRSSFQRIGVAVRSVHDARHPATLLGDAEAIVVGGGNTFRLLERMHAEGLVDRVRERCHEGTPYIGWSAGSNVACPTLMTTNDMPIIQPPRFDAAGLVPFQINPHYLDRNPEGHQGETREQRIMEFVELNRDTPVAGLREGSALRIEGDTIDIIGPHTVRVFRYGEEPREIGPPASLSHLLA